MSFLNEDSPSRFSTGKSERRGSVGVGGGGGGGGGGESFGTGGFGYSPIGFGGATPGTGFGATPGGFGTTPSGQGSLVLEPRWSGWVPSSADIGSEMPARPRTSLMMTASSPPQSPRSAGSLGAGTAHLDQFRVGESASDDGSRGYEGIEVNEEYEQIADNNGFLDKISSISKVGFSWRIFHLVFCFLAIMLAYLMRVDLSSTIIPIALNNHLSGSSQGLLLGSFYLGYICFQIVGGWITTKLGAKWPIAFALIGSSVLTLVFPLAGKSLGELVLLRILMGMVQSTLYPACHHMMSHWVPHSELGKATTFVWSGAYVGTVLSSLIAPLLMDCCGWGSVYEVFGLLSFIWLTPWILFIASYPQTHTLLTMEELYIINPQISVLDLSLSLNDSFVSSDDNHPFASSPYRRVWGIVLRSKSVWGLVVANFTYNWGNFLLLSYLPTFFYQRFHFTSSLATWITAACYIFLTITVFASGALLDRLNARLPHIPYLKKIFFAIGLLSSGALLIILGFINSSGAAIALAIIAVGLLGVALPGYSSNHMDLSPEYAGLLMGLTNTAGALPGAVGVYFSGWILDLTNGSWGAVFSVAAAVMALGTVLYGFLGSNQELQGLEKESHSSSHH